MDVWWSRFSVGEKTLLAGVQLFVFSLPRKRLAFSRRNRVFLSCVPRIGHFWRLVHEALPDIDFSGHRFAVGEKTSLADVKLFVFCRDFFDNKVRETCFN